jgi:hypothetical protein
LSHKIDSTVTGDQPLDVFIVGMVKCARYLARGQRRILKQSVTSGFRRRGGGKMVDGQ